MIFSITDNLLKQNVEERRTSSDTVEMRRNRGQQSTQLIHGDFVAPDVRNFSTSAHEVGVHVPLPGDAFFAARCEDAFFASTHHSLKLIWLRYSRERVL